MERSEKIPSHFLTLPSCHTSRRTTLTTTEEGGGRETGGGRRRADFFCSLPFPRDNTQSALRSCPKSVRFFGGPFAFVFWCITCNFPICPLDSLSIIGFPLPLPSFCRPSAIVNFSTIIVPGSGIHFKIKRAEDEGGLAKSRVLNIKPATETSQKRS